MIERVGYYRESVFFLQTRRTCLMELLQVDFRELCAFLQHPLIREGWGKPFSDMEVMEWLQRQLQSYRMSRFGVWRVYQKRDWRTAGFAGIEWIRWGEGVVPALFCAFWPEYRNRGMATETLRGVLDYAWRLEVKELYAVMEEHNLAAAAVARKLGMQEEERVARPWRGWDARFRVFRWRRERETGWRRLV